MSLSEHVQHQSPGMSSAKVPSPALSQHVCREKVVLHALTGTAGVNEGELFRKKPPSYQRLMTLTQLHPVLIRQLIFAELFLILVFACRDLELPAGDAAEALRRGKQRHQHPRWAHLWPQLRRPPRHHREDKRVRRPECRGGSNRIWPDPAGVVGLQSPQSW